MADQVPASRPDGAAWTADSDLKVHHMAILDESWRSSARAWKTFRHQAFTNDLSRPQLRAVTDNVNPS